MKLPELKSKFKNRYAIRIIAGVLVVTLVATGSSVYSVNAAKAGSAATETVEETEVSEETEDTEDAESSLKELLDNGSRVSEKEIGKEETVYVIADNTGKEQKIIVSDHLINNDDKDTLEDASTLKDIENVKGDETFTQSGNKVTWQADGNDIFYRGTSESELPVTQKLTYYLDGKEVTPEELAGKSGEVTIRFDYTNNQKVTAEIDGKDEDIYVPFMAVSGMILGDEFSDIEVENGKVISDGSNNVVVGYALPGLKESLNVKDSDFDGDVTIPDYVEVKAKVENFKLDTTMTVVMNATNFISADGDNDTSKLDEVFDTLTDAMDQLTDGSAELADGVDTLKSKMGDFKDGVGTLQSGVHAYTDGAGKIASGITQLSDSIPTLSNGVGTLNSSAATIADGVELLDNTLKTSFTDQEKAAMQTQAASAVDAMAEGIKNQASATVDSRAEAIKNQASAVVDSRADEIKSQAEAVVDGRADAIRSQATQMVDGKADDIKNQATQQVTAKFDNGKYDEVKNEAAQEIGANMSSMTGSLTSSADVQTLINGAAFATIAAQYPTETAADIQTNHAAEIAAAQQQIAAQFGNTITTAMGGAVDDLAQGVANAAKRAALETAGEAALGGAKEAAREAAVTGAKLAAGEAAITGAKEAAGEAAVTGAKGAAGEAAVTGAKLAAGTAAVSAAEQTKSTMAASIEQQSSNGYSLVTGARALANGTQSLADAVPALTSGVAQLKNGSAELVSNNQKLNDGVNALSDGTNAVIDGVDQLSDGAHQLADGIVTFNEDGIEKILNSYHGDIEPLMDRIQAVLDAGEDYQTYTDIADGVNGSIKFIYKTDAVKED
jgi:putative membrane protein